MKRTRKTSKSYQYYVLNKPFGVLCQFTDEKNRPTLKQFGPFPRDVYPVGRLDADSEGLLLLTNDGLLKHRLLEPRFQHPRTYLVQVERIPTEDTLEKLRKGILLDGKKTLPVEVELLHHEPRIPPRPVPIRFRKNVPTVWLKITMREGRNRQVRRMTAAVGHPTLRLIRIAMGSLTIEGLEVGKSRTLSQEEVKLLHTSIAGRQNHKS
jgi:pseudouridine synthase